MTQAKESDALKPIEDGILQSLIGELGNQIHNLGCEHQGDEGLAGRLEELRGEAWRIARLAAFPSPTQPASGAEVPEALGFDTGQDASLNLQGALDDLQGRHKINDGGVVVRTLQRVIGQIERVRAISAPAAREA